MQTQEAMAKLCKQEVENAKISVDVFLARLLLSMLRVTAFVPMYPPCNPCLAQSDEQRY